MARIILNYGHRIMDRRLWSRSGLNVNRSQQRHPLNKGLVFEGNEMTLNGT